MSLLVKKKNFTIFANIIFVSNNQKQQDIYFNNEATTSLARAYKRPQFELSEKLACELLLTLPFKETRFSLWCNHVFNYLTLQINPFHLISLNVIMIITCDKDNRLIQFYGDQYYITSLAIIVAKHNYFSFVFYKFALCSLNFLNTIFSTNYYDVCIYVKFSQTRYFTANSKRVNVH